MSGTVDQTGVERRSSRDPVFLACLAAVLAPFVVGLVRVIFVHWTPIGDWALLELRTRGVGGSHTPLIGPYSRFGWSHPGPALFFVLAVPYRLFDSHPNGLLFGVLLVNGASTGAMLALAWRRGGRPLTIGTAIALAVLCRALGATFLRDPWNPYVTVLPVVLLAFLVWSVMCRDTWMLPVAVLVASFVVQSHVGYAALIATMFAVALVWYLVDRARHRGVRRGDRRRGWAIAATTLAVAVVAWTPPLLDQIAHPGNLEAIWNFFQKRHTTPTVDTALRLVGRALAVPASWITGHERVCTAHLFVPAVGGFFVPVALVLLVLGVISSVRARDRDAGALLTLVIAALAAGVYSIAHIAGPLAAYLLRWLLGLGMLAWLASAWALRPRIARVRLGRRSRAAIGAACALLLLVPTAMAVRDAVRSRAPWYEPGRVEAGLARETVANLHADGHPVLLVSKSDKWWTWGLAPRLEAAGFEVASTQRDGIYYGRHRVALRRDARVEVVVVVGPDARTLGRPPGGRLLASYVGPHVPYFPIHRTARYSTIIRLSEENLVGDTVAIYEVRLR